MSFLQQLNTVQADAVKATEGPVLIIAGAGSGKTRVLTFRAAYLVQCGIPPYEILALTFTNKAANEMKNRIVELVGPQSQYVQMGTFHSVFARLLRYECEPLGYNRNFTIYDSDDSHQLIKSVMQELNISTRQFKSQAIRAKISMAKNQMVTPSEYFTMTDDLFTEKVAVVYDEYQKRLQKSNVMDFDDLLIKPIELFTRYPKVLAKYQERFKYILVDEYQDTNRVQYKLVKMLAEQYKNICVVGDDAQSIYSFRGADIRNILDFQKDYPDAKVFRLEQNYRSTKNILNAANGVIKNNTGQIPKKLWTENTDGEEITHLLCDDDKEEGERIAKKIRAEIIKRKLDLRHFAVLYRTNAQSRSIEDALRRDNLPYIIVGGVEFYRRKEIKDVLAYLRVIVNPSDDESLLRIINFPTRGIGDTAMEKIRAAAKAKSLTLFASLQEVGEIPEVQVRAKNAVLKFYQMMWKYIDLKQQISASELARSVVEEIGILKELKEEGTPEALSRWENIQELLSAISEYTDEAEEPTLENFLQEISLVADIDKLDVNKNSITIMTLHAAKGLEFPVVFVAGAEEGLLPMYDNYADYEEVEEERRLMYVGITRAMTKLYISTTAVRYRFGDVTYPTVSRFIGEIDSSYIVEEKSARRQALQTYEGRPAYTPPRKFATTSASREKTFEADSAPDYENESQERVALRAGMRVVHEIFGKGRVLGISGTGSSAKATVEFDKFGRKNLVLQFANLQPTTQ